MINNQDTIAAISTPSGIGGIAVIRISGPDALKTIDEAWKGASIISSPSHTLHHGRYYSLEGDLVDDAVAAIFRAPKSFTGEDTVELNIHGSRWIQKEILRDLIKRGIRIAEPGEFTKRAFLNGKLDLAQAEGVADLISSSSKASHDLAMRQTRGAYSREFEDLRNKLIELASLLELELDFSEEDVEFADRSHLSEITDELISKIQKLVDSYSTGAMLKEGVPVAIAGIPNAGKSSLLNLLLGDDKAIVTDIPGTTRDIIEDTIEIDGILYRFIDTAGLRSTEDIVESKGIERARKSIDKASIVIWILDPTTNQENQFEELNNHLNNKPEGKLIILQNKSDILENQGTLTEDQNFTFSGDSLLSELGFIKFSTKTGEGLQQLKERLKSLATDDQQIEKDLIVTNARHYEALTQSLNSLIRVKEGLVNNLSADFVAQDIREVLHHLSRLTGTISSETLLHSIFSRFCIGK